MSSMDDKIKNWVEQGREIHGEKPKNRSSSSKSASSSQLERINKELQKPNLTAPARKALQEKKAQIQGKKKGNS